MTGWPERLDAARRWPEDIDVWHVAMPAADADIDASPLDDTERARAARYRRREDRVRFMLTRIALRELLGRYLGKPPASLCFASGRYGRPELVGVAGPSWNVSHSGDHALIAISDARTVGVDIERIVLEPDWHDLVALACTAAEQGALAAEPLTLRSQRFFQLWTAKEAVLKALGVGIAQGLHALTIDFASTGVRRPVVHDATEFAEAQALHYCWVMEIPGYMGCLAYGPGDSNGTEKDRSMHPPIHNDGLPA